MVLVLPRCLSLRANWSQTTTYKLTLEELSRDYGAKSTVSEGKNSAVGNCLENVALNKAASFLTCLEVYDANSSGQVPFFSVHQNS